MQQNFKRDILFFLAGAEAFHAFSHAALAITGLLPMRVWKINVTQRMNTAAILINTAVAAGLLYQAAKLESADSERLSSQPWEDVVQANI